MNKTLNKKITKSDIYNPETVTVLKGWFERLYELAQRFESKPTEENKQLLLGYILSIEHIKNVHLICKHCCYKWTKYVLHGHSLESFGCPNCGYQTVKLCQLKLNNYHKIK